MQKSDATPGSLQIPVSDQFWDHLGGFREVKSTQNRKKRVPKAHAKKLQIFGMRKKHQKWTQDGSVRTTIRLPAECAGPPGRFGGVQYTGKVCKNLDIMQ